MFLRFRSPDGYSEGPWRALWTCAEGGCFVKELVRYLLDNMYLDFQGEISVEKVREFLREDDTREARRLLAKIIEEKGVDDLLITLADCLKDHIRTGISDDKVREQLQLYSDS
jgi:hypothetical protein